MKTQFDIESAVCRSISLFEREYMGHEPKTVHVFLLGDLLIVRMGRAMTPAEQHLAKSLPTEKGLCLIKDVRTHLIETARPILNAMIEEITGVKVVTLHHDISTVTGEKVIVFTLEKPLYPRR